MTDAHPSKKHEERQEEGEKEEEHGATGKANEPKAKEKKRKPWIDSFFPFLRSFLFYLCHAFPSTIDAQPKKQREERRTPYFDSTNFDATVLKINTMGKKMGLCVLA